MMRVHVRPHDSTSVLVVFAMVVTGCAGSPKPAQTSVPPPQSAPLLDASYDWRGLVIAPFGSKLKDVPFTLHEVLLFKDGSNDAAQSDDAECYSRDASAPRFVGHTPEQYLLCFKHDRLARVEASVLLEHAEAAQVFADACGLWQRGAAAVPPSVAAPAAPAATGADLAAADPHACSGQSGMVAYSARLDDDATADAAPLSIRLDGAFDQT